MEGIILNDCISLVRRLVIVRFPHRSLSAILNVVSMSDTLRCALKHARMHALTVLMYNDGFNSSGSVGCATVFPYFDAFVSLPFVVSIFTAELCNIFLALFRICIHDSATFFI